MNQDKCCVRATLSERIIGSNSIEFRFWSNLEYWEYQINFVTKTFVFFFVSLITSTKRRDNLYIKTNQKNLFFHNLFSIQSTTIRRDQPNQDNFCTLLSYLSTLLVGIKIRWLYPQQTGKTPPPSQKKGVSWVWN